MAAFNVEEVLGKGTGTGTKAGEGTSKADILSALDDDTESDDKTTESDDSELSDDEVDDDTDSDEDDEDKDTSKKDKSKLDDEEDEDEDDPAKELADEDELELAKIPRRAEIKAKYPTIFKEFPALDHIFHREKAYSEILPTLADARQAKDDQETFTHFKNDLFGGNLDNILEAVKASDKAAYEKITGSYLETLYKIDPAAHLKATNNILKGALKYVYDSVKDANDLETNEGQLRAAVRILNKAIYGSTEVKGPEVTQVKTEEDPEKAKFKTERETFEKTKLVEASSSVTSRLETTFKSYVDKNIDTKDALPVYVKNKLVEDVMSSLDRNLKGDQRYLAVMNKLWIKAREANYSSESLAKIRKLAIDKTKTILPGIMRSKKAEAMKGLGMRRNNNDVKDEVDNSSQRNKEDKREFSDKKTSTKRDSDRNVPKEGESNRDFLMRD